MRVEHMNPDKWWCIQMLESFKKNKKGILLMIVSAVCSCSGQLLWKLSVERGLFFLLAGFGVYGIGALVMIIAYRFGKLSVLQPVLSLNYIISTMLGIFVLKEDITMLKCAGILIIITGVIFIAGGDEGE